MSEVNQYLIKQTYQQLWQGPGADIQHVIRPNRITPRRGALGSIRLGMREYGLPSKGDWYSVFVFGDIPHFMVGMDNYFNQWVSANAHCNNTNILITIYDERGIVYPLKDAYFLYTRDGQVTVALKNTQSTINVLDDPIYIKYRTSSWFSDSNNLHHGEGTRVSGMDVKSINDIATISSTYLEYKQRPGHTWAYVNGRRVHRVHATTIKIGDIVEVVWDGSVREVLKYRLKDLHVFTSIRDSKSKYLIPNVGYGVTVDYKDDIDVYVISHKNPTEYDGVYYHHNHRDSIRNVTHRDFSIPTAYVRGIIDANVRWNLADDIRIEVLVRHSGWSRPIPNTNSNLYDLFQLDHDARILAMVGEHAVVPEWHARSLENSPDIIAMGVHGESIDLELATGALGYSSISKTSSPIIHKVPDTRYVRLGYMHQVRCTVFEYDHNGRLLGYHRHAHSYDYYPKDDNCATIEVYFGWAGPNMGTVFSKTTQQLRPQDDHRFYIARRSIHGDYGQWEDVTGNVDYYHLDDKLNLTWTVDPQLYITAVRRDCDFMVGEIELDRIDRLLLLSVQTDDVYQDHSDIKGWLEIPPGELDVFLNGYLLVEHIDYHVNWPEICIVNTIHRSGNINNTVLVRARGFCDDNLKWRAPKDYGFVYNRALGRRGVYQVIENKTPVVHASGRLLRPETVWDDQWNRRELPQGYNGRPFQIRNPITPLKDTIHGTTTEIFEYTLDFDDRIEHYLTDRLGLVDDELPRDIDNRYVVVSPLLSKLYHDIINGIFPIELFRGAYTNEYLLNTVSRYSYLLKYQPDMSNGLSKFMEVHPHPYLRAIEIEEYKYRVIDLTNRLLLNNQVSLDRSFLLVDPDPVP